MWSVRIERTYTKGKIGNLLFTNHSGNLPWMDVAKLRRDGLVTCVCNGQIGIGTALTILAFLIKVYCAMPRIKNNILIIQFQTWR